MDRERLIYLGINVFGGTAVLGSYAQGLATHEGRGMELWGELPASLIPLYTGVMPFAALGYLVTMAFVLATPMGQLTVNGEPAHRRISFTTAVFLIASSAWMPLCWQALDHADADMFRWIQLVLTVAGACALLNLWTLVRLDRPGWTPFRIAAVIGSAALMVQCTILDGLVWPMYFAV